MNRITIKEASKQMGISEQFLRILIRKDKFRWATATQINGNKGRWTYYINERAFERYMNGESSDVVIPCKE